MRDLLDAILRVVFGHNAVDNTSDWHKAHNKARESRAEVDKIIAESESREREKI